MAHISLVKQLFFYVLYLALICFLQSIFVSLISFFHFLLDHDLGVVNEWITDYGWELIILSKGLIFIFFSWLMLTSHRQETSIKGFIHRWNIKLIDEVWVIIGTLFLLIIYLNVPSTFSQMASFYRSMVSLVGISVFYLSDILILMLLDDFYSYNGKLDIFKLPIYVLFFHLFNQLSFPYATDFGVIYLVYFALSLVLAFCLVPNVSYPAALLFLNILPHFLIFGPDPVWGKQHTILNADQNSSPLSFLVFLLLCFLYLMIRKKNILNKLQS